MTIIHLIFYRWWNTYASPFSFQHPCMCFFSVPSRVFVPHPKFYYRKGIWVFSSFMWGLPTWVARAMYPWVVTISTAADNIILLTLLRSSYCDKVCPPIKLQTILFSHNAAQLILCCCINVTEENKQMYNVYHCIYQQQKTMPMYTLLLSYWLIFLMF